MKVRGSIFGSKSEYKLFRSLQHRWSKEFDLWTSLPLSSIVELEKNETALNDKEKKFFYKTNIDYTLCTKSGIPILSIEFDGLGKGYSRNGEYIQIDKTKDPYRKFKLDLKLKIARKLNYPLYVISFEESKEIAPEISLSIVDGIIGQVLAKKEFKEKIKNYINECHETIDSLPRDYRDEYIQDLIVTAETLAELEKDPIAKLASKYEHESIEKGVVKNYKIEFLTDPPLPNGDIFKDPGVVEKRIKKFGNSERIGCRITINTSKIIIIKTLWLRNFRDIFISPEHIAENICKIIAFRKLIDSIKMEV